MFSQQPYSLPQFRNVCSSEGEFLQSMPALRAERPSEVCSFGTFCLGRQQLNSETADFTGEAFHSQNNRPTDFRRFRRLQLKNEALKAA